MEGITTDQKYLETVNGQRIEFTKPPVQQKMPLQLSWSDEQGNFIDSEIKKLIKKNVIISSGHEAHEFIFLLYFLDPKKMSQIV